MRKGLGFHNRHSAGGFNPASLFAGGVQGAWYDPSDLTTLFQDSAGTTPVTAVEQPVGLMLDKSKGLVLGPELAGSILSGTSGWTFVGAATVSGGAIVFTTPPSTNASAQYNPIVSSGLWYRVQITLTGTGQVTVQLGSAGTSATFTAPGSYSFTGLASGGTPTVLTFSSVLSGVNNFVGSVTAVSVRTLAGNHAFQSTSASRPTLRARYNLLTRTEQLTDAAWTKQAGTSVNASPVADPSGALTAWFVTGNGTSGIFQAIAGTVSLGQTIRSVYLRTQSGTATVGIKDPVQTQGTTTCNVTTTWQRFTLTETTPPTGGFSCGIWIFNIPSSGIEIAWPQVVPTAVFPSNTYQRVGAATDYATGAAFPPYLFCDGTDDSMLTNSVNFTGTDKMLVVAGVTKSSDAAVGIIAELSTNFTDFGGWYLINSASPVGYQYSGRGNRVGNDNDTVNAPIAGPNTSVLTTQQNLNNNTPATIRRNGALAGSSVNTTFGGGNFGNYPLYIGRRNNASLPFNGNIYSLVIAGQSYTAGQISSTESWVAAKTPLGTI